MYPLKQIVYGLVSFWQYQSFIFIPRLWNLLFKLFKSENQLERKGIDWILFYFNFKTIYLSHIACLANAVNMLFTQQD